MPDFCVRLCVCTIHKAQTTPTSAEDAQVLARWLPDIKTVMGANFERLYPQLHNFSIREHSLGQYYAAAFDVSMADGRHLCTQVFMSTLESEMRQRAVKLFIDVINAPDAGEDVDLNTLHEITGNDIPLARAIGRFQRGVCLGGAAGDQPDHEDKSAHSANIKGTQS
jgi:hypothetical protein